jgi:protein ImuB
MLWLALHLPLLSLEAFCATLTPEQRERPAVLLTEHRVTHVNAAAAERGIRPGMKRATALALAGDLLVADADVARDAAALQAVAHAALACTPAVTLHDEQTVLLDVQASLRLFHGLPALWRRLLASVVPLGHRVQSAAAPTALGAALLARWQPGGPQAPSASSAAAGHATEAALPGPHAATLRALQDRLDSAPVWLLGPGREHWDALQGMGLQTLSDLRQLPRTGLARRFGEDLVGDLDRALGLQPDPRVWALLPAVFESRLELYARAETTDQVLAGAAVLLARLVAWAQARQVRIAIFTLAMQHEDHRHAAVPASELRIELAEPALDAGHLQLLLRERLGRVELVAPTLELRLHCRHTVAAPAPNGELFPTHSSQAEGLTRLLERLRARLGDDQVQRLEAVADHRPECASRSVPAHGAIGRHPAGPPGAPGAPGGSPRAVSTLPLHRPTWLLPEPLPLAARGALPLLQGRPLQLLSGPERIESGWWDGQAVARDYFIAQTDDGSLVWVYRARVPGAVGDVDWHLQGRFA